MSIYLIALLIVIPILSVNQVRFELSNSYKEPIQIVFIPELAQELDADIAFEDEAWIGCANQPF